MRAMWGRAGSGEVGGLRTLLVEDDADLGRGLQKMLSREGMQVDWVRSGEGALGFLHDGSFDIVILDLGLPDIDGIEVLGQMRERGDATPVLILTARGDLEDRVAGLQAGADDYLAKPFDVIELVARVQALERRSKGRASSLIEEAGVSMDTRSREVHFRGQPVELSRREFGLLKALIESHGEVLSREDLERSLYGWEGEVSSNTLEVHIHALRKKLDKTILQTVRGVGYKLVADD